MWREDQINKDLKFCHPKWPEERSYLEREIETLDELLPGYFHDFWNFFDWSIYFLNIVVFVTHIVDVYYPSDPNARQPACCTPNGCLVTQEQVNNGTFTMKETCVEGAVNNSSLSAWNNRIFVLNIILIWLRLMKNMRAFRTLGPFVVMLGKIFYDILRFLFLYFEFYIPYACAFWMIFGDEPSISSMQTVDNMLFSLYRITLVDDYQFDEMQAFDIVMAYILVGTFLGISAILCINLFIALLSDTFQRVYDNANSNAYMQQAMLCLNIEDNLSTTAKEKFLRYLQTKCAPLEEYYDDDLTTLQDDNLKKVTIQIKEQMDELFDHLQIGEYQDSDYYEYRDRSLLSRMSSRPEMDPHSNEGIHRLASDLSVVSDVVSTLRVNNDKTLKRMQTDIKEIKKILQQLMSKEEKRRKKRDHELLQQSDYAGSVPLPIFPIEITTLPPPHAEGRAYSSIPQEERLERMHTAPRTRKSQSTQEDIMKRLGTSSLKPPFYSAQPDEEDLEMLFISESPQPQNLLSAPSPTSGPDIQVRVISDVDPNVQPGSSSHDDPSGVGSSKV